MCTNFSDKTDASIVRVRWYLSTKLHDIPLQKTASLTVNGVTTSELTYYHKTKSNRSYFTLEGGRQKGLLLDWLANRHNR